MGADLSEFEVSSLSWPCPVTPNRQINLYNPQVPLLVSNTIDADSCGKFIEDAFYENELEAWFALGPNGFLCERYYVLPCLSHLYATTCVDFDPSPVRRRLGVDELDFVSLILDSMFDSVLELYTINEDGTLGELVAFNDDIREIAGGEPCPYFSQLFSLIDYNGPRRDYALRYRRKQFQMWCLECEGECPVRRRRLGEDDDVDQTRRRLGGDECFLDFLDVPSLFWIDLQCDAGTCSPTQAPTSTTEAPTGLPTKAPNSDDDSYSDDDSDNESRGPPPMRPMPSDSDSMSYDDSDSDYSDLKMSDLFNNKDGNIDNNKVMSFMVFMVVMNLSLVAFLIIGVVVFCRMKRSVKTQMNHVNNIQLSSKDNMVEIDGDNNKTV